MLFEEFNILTALPWLRLPVVGFPLQTPDFSSMPVHFRLVVEDVTLVQVFLEVFHSATANTDDTQFQKYTALEILRSVKLSLDILFYLSS